MSITSTGFQTKTLQQIIDDLKAGFTEQFGAGFILDESNPAIQHAAIFSKQLADAWEGLEAAYYSAYLNEATGKQLDEVAALVGSTRQPATSSTVPVYGRGTPSTSIITGFTCSSDAGDFFESQNDFTLSAQGDLTLTSITSIGTTATATLAGHPYIDGDVLFITGADQTEYNGWYAIFNVTATTFDYIFAGSATSPATGTIIAKYGTPITVFSQETGPIQALAGGITTIETTVSGLDAIYNLADATLGQEEETDSEFRERTVTGLASLAGGTLPGIKAKLLNVTGVTSAIVYENDTGETVDGRPPYTVNAFVVGGTDQDVIDGLGPAKGAGVATFGNVSGTWTDDDGISHTIKFSRLAEVDIYVDTTIVANTDLDQGPVFDAIGGPAAIEQAIVDYGATLEAGHDVWYNNIASAIGAIAGVAQITVLLVDTIPSPVGTSNITISATAIAAFDTANINVTVT